MSLTCCSRFTLLGLCVICPRWLCCQHLSLARSSVLTMLYGAKTKNKKQHSKGTLQGLFFLCNRLNSLASPLTLLGSLCIIQRKSSKRIRFAPCDGTTCVQSVFKIVAQRWSCCSKSENPPCCNPPCMSIAIHRLLLPLLCLHLHCANPTLEGTSSQ